MDESIFNRLADETLERIEAAVEHCGVDLDFELSPGGVLEIEFENGSKIIVNRHAIAREIWVAARSGGFHFRREGARWVDTRDQAELFEKLSQLASEHAGQPVVLAER